MLHNRLLAVKVCARLGCRRAAVDVVVYLLLHKVDPQQRKGEHKKNNFLQAARRKRCCLVTCSSEKIEKTKYLHVELAVPSLFLLTCHTMCLCTIETEDFTANFAPTASVETLSLYLVVPLRNLPYQSTSGPHKVEPPMAIVQKCRQICKSKSTLHAKH